MITWCLNDLSLLFAGRKPSPDIPKPEPEPFVNKRLGLLLIAGLICAIGVYIAYNGNDNMLPGPVKGIQVCLNVPTFMCILIHSSN